MTPEYNVDSDGLLTGDIINRPIGEARHAVKDKCHNHDSLRTGSLRERKKIRRAKCESGSEASGSRMRGSL